MSDMQRISLTLIDAPKAPPRAKRKAGPAATRKSVAGKADVKAAAASQADAVVQRIKDEQRNLARNEGHAVAGLIAIGVQLVALHEATKVTRDWTRRVETLGYNPRVARGLQEIGNSWWGQIGPLGPEILERLPNDVHKLVAICRLPSNRLPGFLDAINCKEDGRQRVIDAVKSELGEGKKPMARPIQPDKIVASFEKAASRTITALKEATGVIADDMCDRLRKVLDEALDEPQVASASATSLAADPPEAMPCP